MDEEMQTLWTLYMTVEKARVQPYTTKSEFARIAATEVGICASEGLITTRLSDGKFTNVWMATPQGLRFLEEMADVFSD